MTSEHTTDSPARTTDRDAAGGSDERSVVRCERRLAASPQRVWQAWTDPALLGRWFRPDPELDLTVSADVRVGGAFTVAIGSHVAVGEYLEVDPPRRLAFTWRWRDLDSPAGLVVVELAPSGEGTALVLTHSGLLDQTDADNHAQGWEGLLSRLPDVL
jgi:uncharacterized protein YndB with AHSA1/START domain